MFSTTEALHIDFVTKSGRVEPTKKPYVPYWEMEEDSKVLQKGFKAEFVISSHFVNLGQYLMRYFFLSQMVGVSSHKSLVDPLHSHHMTRFA